jgi:hypothetical protein
MFNRDQIMDALHSAICDVTFTKSNGDERVMKCTLNEDIVPPFEVKGTKKKNDEVVSVWDIEKSAWRSFRIDSVKSLAMRA